MQGQRKSLFLVAALSVCFGVLMAHCTDQARATSTDKKKECGVKDDDTGKFVANSDCPDCLGSCKTEGKKYKTCTGTGDTCEDDDTVACSGDLYDNTKCEGCDMGACQIEKTGCKPAT